MYGDHDYKENYRDYAESKKSNPHKIQICRIFPSGTSSIDKLLPRAISFKICRDISSFNLNPISIKMLAFDKFRNSVGRGGGSVGQKPQIEGANYTFKRLSPIGCISWNSLCLKLVQAFSRLPLPASQLTHYQEYPQDPEPTVPHHRYRATKWNFVENHQAVVYDSIFYTYRRWRPGMPLSLQSVLSGTMLTNGRLKWYSV